MTGPATGAGPQNEMYESVEFWRAQRDDYERGAVGKVEDILPGLLAAVDAVAARGASAAGAKAVRIIDAGAGIGAVLARTLARLREERPGVLATGVALEPSAAAIDVGRELHPELEFVRGSIGQGPAMTADIVMFIDVLEHVEALLPTLRAARQASRFMVVRQPLIESALSYRLDSYAREVREYGHINFFNARSFQALCAAAGWRPLALTIAARWELFDQRHTAGEVKPWKIELLAKDRLQAAWDVGDFYANGSFEAVG